MIVLLSPAKKLEFNNPNAPETATQPVFLEQSEKLINKLSRLSRKKIAALMSLSANLAELNYNRYQNWSLPFTKENALQAIYAFRGDVYIGFDADSMTEENRKYAQEHVRILSGLHGVLKPLDLIQPHRLEMGTKLPIARKKNLYEYWKKNTAQFLKEDLAQDGSNVIVNLASHEYFKSVDTKALKGARIVTCSFKENKEGALKTIMIFAKQARGSMARFIVDEQIENPEELKGFNRDGYSYYAAESDEDNFCFVR